MEVQGMKNDLTCGVVRDLLPNYVDGHLCVEPRRAVDLHLAGCSGVLAFMRETEPRGGRSEADEAAEQPKDHRRSGMHRARSDCGSVGQAVPYWHVALTPKCGDHDVRPHSCRHPVYPRLRSCFYTYCNFLDALSNRLLDCGKLEQSLSVFQCFSGHQPWRLALWGAECWLNSEAAISLKLLANFVRLWGLSWY